MKNLSLKIAFIGFIFLFTELIHAQELIKTRNFGKTKIIAQEIFSDHKTSFYCGCEYDNNLRVNHLSCGYQPRKNTKRSQKIEWEHIVPAKAFGSQMKSQCWHKAICIDKKGQKFKGRKCCLQIDRDFNVIYNDLHNLVPAIGEINNDRKNYRFGNIIYNTHYYGQCNFKVDPLRSKAEPKNDLKGTVARVYLYFQQKYHLQLSRNQEKLYLYWHKLYPPKKWEIEWNKKIFAIQKDTNPFICARPN